jgi:acyl-homoserine-lactone acylase
MNNPRHPRFIVLLLSLLLTLGFAQPNAQKGTEVLWDTWGVPHIFAQSEQGAFYAYGWAQAQNHGELILKLYAQARGRAAEHYGEGFLESDRAVHLTRIPQRAQTWLRAQRPEFRKNLEAFAAGFNAYLAANLSEFTAQARRVLPVSVTDLLAHTIRDLSLFIATECSSAVPGLNLGGQPGSNGWAIAPSRSQSGKALLMANPHLGWGGLTLFFEAQVKTPSADIYGSTLVGVPVPMIAFNDHLGWTHTTNTHDGCDLYALQLEAGGYRLDGKVQPFKQETHNLKVRQDDGSFKTVTLNIKRSLHGPVVQEQGGKALAMRMVGVDVGDFSGLLEQWWDMAKSKNRSEFERVLSRNQLPSQNVIYADTDGQIMLLFAGRVPMRSKGDSAFWRTPVAGDSSALVWNTIHPHRDLPKLVNPTTGWLQNSNSAPWYMTSQGAPKPHNFPAYLSPQGPVIVREQRGIQMLMGDPSISVEELVGYKHDTFALLADRVLDDLLSAARKSGKPALEPALKLLSSWDKHIHADSKGAALFYLWFMNYFQASLNKNLQQNPTFVLNEASFYSTAFYRTPWDTTKPYSTPSGLAHPELAVLALEAAVQALQGQVDVPWGAVARMRFGKMDIPAAGGPGELGVFRVAEVAPDTDGQFRTVWGDSYVAVIEFSKPIRAQVLNTYGNSSQAASPHTGDQLAMAAKQQLRPVWRERAQILQNLKTRIAW